MNVMTAIHIDDRRSLFIGSDGITRFVEGTTNGDNALLLTIDVYKGNQLFATYVFKNILGCEYSMPTPSK